MDVVSPVLNLQWIEAFVHGDHVGAAYVDSGATQNFQADDGDALRFDLTAPGAAYPGWSYTVDFGRHSYPNHQLLCTDTTKMTIPYGCTRPRRRGGLVRGLGRPLQDQAVGQARRHERPSRPL